MEWTPNELADVLRNWIGNRDQLLAAANILQNQEQEIELLKKSNNYLSTRVINLSQEIADLKIANQDLKYQLIIKSGEQVLNDFKKFSDEEIMQIWQDSDWGNGEEEDILFFARAILKKAQNEPT
jgi:hypothetical protein